MAQPKETIGGMNRKSWKAQRTMREIAEWHTWIGTSLANFTLELKGLVSTKNMPPEDIKNLGAIQERLDELKQHLKPLERTLHQATGQRIKRSRKKKDAA